ncbi:MAG: hypothetical protein ACRD0K_23315 [Egibacteraceae bacterium]
MKLTWLGDDCPVKGVCPTIYATDRGTLVVQGYVVSDPEALATMNLPPGETAVEVSKELLRRGWGNAAL